MIDFVKARAVRAWIDLKGFAKSHVPGVVFALFASFIALPLVKLWGIADWQQEASLLALYSLIGPAVMFAASAVVFYGLAGGRIYREQLQELTSFRQRLNADLVLDFNAGGPGYIVESPMLLVLDGRHIPSKWVRARLVNHGLTPASGCEVFLHSVHRLDAGRLVPTEYTDTLHLNFSNLGRDPQNLAPGIPKFIDLVSTNSRKNRMELQTSPGSFRLNSLFKTPATYRLALQAVDGNGRRSNLLQVDVAWSGNWNTVTAVSA